MYFKLLIFFLFTHLNIIAQAKVLVFTKTNGYTHPSISQGVTMITNLGNTNGLWNTEQTSDASAFTTSNLANYKAVIWCNTSGNNLLNTLQKQAFENYIRDGGGYLGIHAATDTYRDRSWSFYNELVGAIVQSGPNHTANNFNATMTVLNPHPSVDFLGTTWSKQEEYYYWRNNGGYLYPGNINLLRVEATGSNDYDEARPISWYKEYKGGRTFYTALGHNASDYTNNTNFIKHIEEGVKYVIGNTLNVVSYKRIASFKITPNPVENDILHLSITNVLSTKSLYIFDINGKFKYQSEIPAATKYYYLNIANFSEGIYFAKIKYDDKQINIKFIKN